MNVREVVCRHKRKLWFGAVGGSGVILSFLILALCVEVLQLSTQAAYVIQMVIVVEYNFVLNYVFTWSDRKDKRFWRVWSRFHLVRVATIIWNQLFFAVLTWVGLHYMLANAVCVATMTVINYIAGDRFVFRGSSKRPDGPLPKAEIRPSVSVVIPAKHNDDTIRHTVESLVSQSYSGEMEIIIVGDHADTTWRSLQDYIAAGTVRAIEVDVISPGRDSNVKRRVGLGAATGDVLAVLDSDMVMPRHWLQRAIEHISNGQHAVAGPLSGLGDGFWTRYIDKNPTASKTPRIKGVATIDRKSLRWRKLPVTANFVCTREVYESVGGPNATFTNSYEDYEWFSRIVRAGYNIVTDAQLAGERYHREGFKPLLREYFRSGRGCADFMVVHPRCPFAQTRLIQLLAVITSIVLTAVAFVLQPTYTLEAVALGMLALTSFSFLKVRRLEALAYPILSLVLTSAFVFGVARRITKRGLQAPVHPVVGEIRHLQLVTEQ